MGPGRIAISTVPAIPLIQSLFSAQGPGGAAGPKGDQVSGCQWSGPIRACPERIHRAGQLFQGSACWAVWLWVCVHNSERLPCLSSPFLLIFSFAPTQHSSKSSEPQPQSRAGMGKAAGRTVTMWPWVPHTLFCSGRLVCESERGLGSRFPLHRSSLERCFLLSASFSSPEKLKGGRAVTCRTHF